MTRDELLPHIPARLRPEEQEAWIQNVLETHPGHKTGEEAPMQPEGSTRDLDGIRRALGDLAQRVEALKPPPAFDATGIERGLKAVQQSVAGIPAPAPVNLDGIRQSIGEMHATLDNLGVENRVAHRELLQAVADMKPIGITTEGGLRLVEVPKIIEAPAPVDRWKTPFRLAVLVLLAALFALSARGQADPATIIRDPAYKSSGRPSGTAGGDLSGTYPNPTVAKLSGTALSLTNVSSLSSGVIADYHFDQGSGTTLTDYSGNGYNGTLVNSPTWGIHRLIFTAASHHSVTVPLAVYTGAKTLTFVVDATQACSNSAEMMLFGTDNINGFSPELNTGFCYPGIYNQVTRNTTGNTGYAGIAILTYVSSVTAGGDRIYLNGVDITNGSGSTGSSRLGTVASIGGWPAWGSQFWFGGSMYWATFNSNELTAAQVRNDQAYIVQQLSRSNVYLGGNNTTTGNYAIFRGDSRTAGQGGTPYPNQLSLTDTYSKLNLGVGGAKISDMVALDTGWVDPLFPRSGSKNLYVLWGCYNDMNSGTSTAAQCYQNLITVTQARRRAGFKVIIATEISATGTGTGGATMDTLKNQLNVLIRANWPYFADGLADLASNPLLGADGAYSNATYYVDGVHLTTAGYGLVAAIVSTAINRVAGPENLVNQHLACIGAQAPAIASGFGTSPSIAGSDCGGRVTVGTGGSATTGAITFVVPWTTAPACTANDETTTLLVKATATTTTLTLTSASAWTAADKLTWTCIGY